MSDALDPAHLMGHVKDAEYFEVPRFIAADGHIALPQPLALSQPLTEANTTWHIAPLDLRLTKFMVLEVVAAVLMAAIFIWLAGRLRSGHVPRGRLWNLFESMLVYIRDQVARPAIGKHDADRFLPFLWTLFFFILICNLLGMLPWSGTPTASLATTLALAVITFSVVVGSGMAKLGAWGFAKAQVPHMDLPLPMAIILFPMIFVLEVFGLLVKHFVLAIRLLANMLAGHLVLAVILAFIAQSWGTALIWGVAPASVFGAMALSLLELLVAFIQAYVFTVLSALFIGMAVHPH